MIAKITIIAAALALGPALAAHQAPAQAAEQIAVPYGDLDLTTAQGLKALNQRIKAAAVELCPAYPADMRHWVVQRCVAETLVRTGPQVADATMAARNAHDGNRYLAVR